MCKSCAITDICEINLRQLNGDICADLVQLQIFVKLILCHYKNLYNSCAITEMNTISGIVSNYRHMCKSCANTDICAINLVPLQTFTFTLEQLHKYL